MEEQLISFETAKLSKEKGLDWEVDNGYNNDSQLLCNDRQRELEYNYNGEEDRTSAPTQSLLQKWLRDVHNIDVIPTISKSHKIKRYCFPKGDVIIYENDKSFDTVYKYFDTYEEALEKGLQQALKLINK